MKKRVKSLLLCAATALTVGAFATACEEELPHVHTYSEDWTADAEGHFHQATCDDAEDEAKQPHVDKNNDGACDICEYTDHTHTYSEDWTVDCTNHWHATDCGHTVAGEAKAAHVDENEDGECDVCKYVIEDIHEHYFDSKWTSDESYHWHAALCEHKGEIDGKAAHELNAAGDCTVCGEHIQDVAMTDIGAVLNAAVANNYKIIDGSVVFDNKVYGGTGAQTLQTGLTNEVYFVLGNGESYINMKSFDMYGNFLGVEEQWHQEVGDEEYFGVVLEDVSVNPTRELAPTSSEAQFLNGYNYIPGSVIPSDSVDTSTLSAMLVALYNQMKAGVHVSNAGEEVVDGVYRFMYTYYSVNVTTSGGVFENIQIELYNVRAQFTVNEDMIIDWAEFEVEVYRDFGDRENPDSPDNDFDLDYTYEIGADGATATLTSDVTLKDTANPTYYRYSVAQRSGERTFTSPYPRESLLPKDFELSYVTKYCQDNGALEILEETKVTDTLTIEDSKLVTFIDEYGYPMPETLVEAKKYVRLHLGNEMPITASCSFINEEDLEISFVNMTDGATGSLWTMEPTYNKMTNCIAFNAKDAGTYELTIKYKEVVKTITVIVPEETSGDVGEDDENTINVETTDTYGWEDLYSYTANAEGTYTFNLPAGLGMWNKEGYDNFSSNPEMDFYENTEGASISIDLKVDETFEFYVGATEKKAWVITVSFEAGTVGGGDEGGEEGDSSKALVIGNNEIVAKNVTYTYTAGSAGTLTLTAGQAIMGMVSISYTVDGGESTVLELGTSVELTLTAGSVVVITVEAEGYSTITAAWAGEGGSEEGGETPAEPTEVYAALETAGEHTLSLENNTYITATIYLRGDYTVTWTGNVNVEMVVMGNNIPLDNGGTIACSLQGTYLKIYADDYVAVDSFTLTLTAESSEEGGEGDGTESNPYVWDTLPASVTINSDTINKVYYLFTATESGAITFTYPTADSWIDIFEMDGTNTTQNNGSGMETETFSFEIEMGKTYRVGIGTWAVAGEVTITISVGESTGDGEEGGEGGETVLGSSDNPYVLTLGESQDLEITQTLVESYYVYCTLTVTEAGWYSFNSFWFCSGDNKVIENATGVWIYAEADTTMQVYKYVETVGTLTVKTAKESLITASADNGDSAENGISIVGVGAYGVNVDYNVCADGMYVNFTVTEDGIYTFNFSNFNNTLTYNDVVYCSNGDNGDLVLNVKVGNTYSFLLKNIGFDDDNNAIETSGVCIFNVEKLPTLAVAENVVVGSGEAEIVYAISVETSGTYTITIEDKANASIYLDGNEISISGYSEWSECVYSQVVALEAGKIYTTTVYFPTDENWKPMSGEWKITIAEGGTIKVNEATLAIGDNQIEAENITYTYTAESAGTLTLTAGQAIMGMVSISYTIDGGESTVLELGANVELTLAADSVVVITVEAEGYSSITAAWAGEGEEGSEA